MTPRPPASLIFAGDRSGELNLGALSSITSCGNEDEDKDDIGADIKIME